MTMRYETGVMAPLRWPVRVLGTVAWLSMFVFAVYIVAFYAGSLASLGPQNWNKTLPDLFSPETPGRTIVMGLHFLAGATLLAFGPIQFLRVVRQRLRWLHQTIGVVYASAGLTAGIAGTAFIAMGGTVGGPVMNIGFASYGILMTLCAFMTPLMIVRGDRDAHRAWAMRFFALAIASWLYRMEYGLILGLLDGAGHSQDFRGLTDRIMSFAFYVPNLLMAELLIRRPVRLWPPSLQTALGVVISLLTALLAFGSFFYITKLWGPAILKYGPYLFGTAT